MRRLTRKQREEAVLLLRCAADVGSLHEAGYALGHVDYVNPADGVYIAACMTVSSVPWPPWLRRDRYLEAAALLEEGSL